VHVGFSDSLSHYAINHLSDYVNTLLLVIFDTVKSSNYLSNLTLDDVILSNQLVVDNKIKSVDKNTFDKISDLEFSVII
ncbi:hypothetical protein, partial [Proteus terrae]